MKKPGGVAWGNPYRTCRFYTVTVLAVAVLVPWCLPAFAEAGAESLRLRVTNSPGGAVEVSRDAGATWRTVGQVTVPAERVNPRGYRASAWAHDSAVAATAVNALHVRVAENPEAPGAVIFSLIPGGTVVGAATRERTSAIVTDIPGGEGLFGWGLGPYVNSPVFIQREELLPLPPDYQPAEGDVLVIIRHKPTRPLRFAVFENRPGGAVTLEYGDGTTETVGVVDQAVSGIGRFEGGIYAAPGRIRANHSGVIDVATSPIGLMGGFQIIPRSHARSPEMPYVATGTQWLVIGPVDENALDLAGQPPFFSGYIVPSYRPDDVLGDHADWMQRTLSRAMVQVRINNGPWRLMPRVALDGTVDRDNGPETDYGLRLLWRIPADVTAMVEPLPPCANAALAGVTHVRIAFPQADFWPEENR